MFSVHGQKYWTDLIYALTLEAPFGVTYKDVKHGLRGPARGLAAVIGHKAMQSMHGRWGSGVGAGQLHSCFHHPISEHE